VDGRRHEPPHEAAVVRRASRCLPTARASRRAPLSTHSKSRMRSRIPRAERCVEALVRFGSVAPGGSEGPVEARTRRLAPGPARTREHRSTSGALMMCAVWPKTRRRTRATGQGSTLTSSEIGSRKLAIGVLRSGADPSRCAFAPSLGCQASCGKSLPQCTACCPGAAGRSPRRGAIGEHAARSTARNRSPIALACL